MCPIMEATPKIGHNKGIRRASTPCRLPSIRTSLSANLSALTRHLPLVLSMALLFPSLQNLSSVLVQRLWPPHTGAHCSFLSPRAWDVGAFYLESARWRAEMWQIAGKQACAGSSSSWEAGWGRLAWLRVETHGAPWSWKPEQKKSSILADNCISLWSKIHFDCF